MTAIMDELGEQHQALLDLIERPEKEEAVAQVLEFLERLAKAGTDVADPRQRSQLRGLIRFWSSFIYDHTRQFPEVQLLPALAPATAPGVSEAEAVVTPKQIGPYEIIEEIGEGGFSKVYKALDTVAERLVALKVLLGQPLQQSQKVLERLLERERLAAELKHTNIIRVYSVAEYDGVPCIAMELIEKGSLAVRLAEWYWEPSTREIMEIALQVTEGLAYLHDKQIVHRDIKPANILLSKDNHVYLTDFGIAQVIESAFKGEVVGTPEYLAPEVILHPDNVDARADLYSLGIILFELFLGRMPFQAKLPAEVLYLQVNQPLPPMSDLPDQVFPKEIADMVSKCLDKDPDRRFQSAQELSREIKRLLSSLPDMVLDVHPARFATGPETRTKPHDSQVLSSASVKELVAKLRPDIAVPATPPQPMPPPRVPSPPPLPMPSPQPPQPPPAPLPQPFVSAETPTGSYSFAPPQSSDERRTVLLTKGQLPSYQAVLAIFIVQSGSLTQDHFVVRQSRVTIGRGRYNDIVVDEPSVSRQHALLVYKKAEGKQGAFTLYDLASANGIFVNEAEKPTTKCQLEHNDTITLGEVKLLFKRLDDGPEPIPDKSDGEPTKSVKFPQLSRRLNPSR